MRLRDSVYSIKMNHYLRFPFHKSIIYLSVNHVFINQSLLFNHVTSNEFKTRSKCVRAKQKKKIVKKAMKNKKTAKMQIQNVL